MMINDTQDSEPLRALLWRGFRRGKLRGLRQTSKLLDHIERCLGRQATVQDLRVDRLITLLDSLRDQGTELSIIEKTYKSRLKLMQFLATRAA